MSTAIAALADCARSLCPLPSLLARWSRQPRRANWHSLPEPLAALILQLALQDAGRTLLQRQCLSLVCRCALPLHCTLARLYFRQQLMLQHADTAASRLCGAHGTRETKRSSVLLVLNLTTSKHVARHT